MSMKKETKLLIKIIWNSKLSILMMTLKDVRIRGFGSDYASGFGP